jgi:hypothetical protein
VVKGLRRASRPSLIEGYAIVSSDCMIADADGTMDALKFEVDQQFFLASVDAAAPVPRAGGVAGSASGLEGGLVKSQILQRDGRDVG